MRQNPILSLVTLSPVTFKLLKLIVNSRQTPTFLTLTQTNSETVYTLFVFCISRVFHERFCETHHKIQNTHPYANFVFYKCHEKINHEILPLFAQMPTLVRNTKKGCKIPCCTFFVFHSSFRVFCDKCIASPMEQASFHTQQSTKEHLSTYITQRYPCFLTLSCLLYQCRHIFFILVYLASYWPDIIKKIPILMKISHSFMR